MMDGDGRRRSLTPRLIPTDPLPFHEPTDVRRMKLILQSRPKGIGAAPTEIVVEVLAHRR